MPTLTTIILRSFGSFNHGNHRRKRNKTSPNWKRSKTVTVCQRRENPEDVTRKLLELINEFGKVARYKFNAQKPLSFLYTNNEK